LYIENRIFTLYNRYCSLGGSSPIQAAAALFEVSIKEVLSFIPDLPAGLSWNQFSV
jgi:hypothetical protein